MPARTLREEEADPDPGAGGPAGSFGRAGSLRLAIARAFRSADELRGVFTLGAEELITCCTIGGRPSTSWFVLIYLPGHDRVRVYDGSWAEWGRAAGAPVGSGDQLPMPARGAGTKAGSGAGWTQRRTPRSCQFQTGASAGS